MRNIVLMLKNNFNRNLGAIVLIVAGIFIFSSSLDAGNLFQVDDTFDAKGMPIGLLDNDNTELSGDLENYLGNTLNMKLYTEENVGVSEEKLEDELTDLLINKKISAIIEVPKNFEKAAISGDFKKLEYTALDDYENVAFLEIYLNTYMQKVQILSKGADGIQESFRQMLSQSTGISSEMHTNNEESALAQQQRAGFTMSAGVFLMFSLGVAAVVALAVFDDRKTGTYSRMQISPVKPWEYITGTTLAGIILGFVFALGYIATLLIKKIDTGMPIWLITSMVLLFTLFSVGFSLIVALLAKSKAVIFASIMGATTILCVLGGAWFPVDRENALLSRLAALTPHYWFMELIRDMQKNGQFDYRPSLLMLILFVALTYLISAALFTRKQ